MRERWSTRGQRWTVVVAALLAVRVAPVLAANPVFVDAAGACAGSTPCFTTIQDGVNNADPGAVVFILPGTYPESVDLSKMGSAIAGSPGDITLAVGKSAADVLAFLAPDAVIMHPNSGAAFFNSVSPFPGRVEIIGGFTVVSKDSDGVRLHTTDDVSVVGVNSSGNDLGGIVLTSDNGEVMAVLARADNNKGNGMDLNALGDSNVAILNATANQNGGNGINAFATNGGVSVLGFIQIPGFPSTTTADNNAGNGMNLTAGGGDLMVGLLPIFALNGALPPSVTSKLPATSIPRTLMPHGLDRFHGLTALFTTPPPTMLGPVTANGNGGDGIDADATGNETAVGVTTNQNGNIGFATLAGGSAFLLACSADNNMASGFSVSTMGSASLQLVTAFSNGGDGITILNADSEVVGAAYISANTDDGVNILALGMGSPDVVAGSIICNNGGHGLRVQPSVAVDAEGNWWGAFNGPAPSGSGNAVMGTNDFTPFIDTVTVKAPPLPGTVGFLSPFDFQFSGGNGTVFLGAPSNLTEITLGPGDPFGVPPFTLTTDNGVLVSTGFEVIPAPVFTQTATTVGGFINRPNGVLRVQALPGRAGQVTVSLLGPCGLTGSAEVAVKPVPAPVLSDGALGILAALLAMAGFWVVRRRSMVEA